MSHSVEEDDAGLKDLVSRTLAENGALGKIQAQLRASVFLALEDEFREKDIPLCNTRTKELLQTPAGSLAASLVHEFFTCLGLDFSLAVYGPESNLGAKLWDLHTRECLLKAMGLGEDVEPMTPLLIRLCSHRPAVPSTAAALPVETGCKLVHGTDKKAPISSSNGSQASKIGLPGTNVNNASSAESRTSQSVNNNKIPTPASTNGAGVSASSSGVPKGPPKLPNATTSNDANKRTSATSSTAPSNQASNVVANKGNSNKNTSNDGRANTDASSKETSTLAKNNPSVKSNQSRRVSPPNDILSAAPPETDSSEASSSDGDVAALLQDTRLGVKKELSGRRENNLEKEKTLSDGDYEDDFSEGSSQSTNSANDEETSTSSWGHPPLPATKSKAVNVLKNDISDAKTSSQEPSNSGKETSVNLKSVDSSAPRRRSLDLLDDDVSIEDFVSSESSSAREETEDIVYNKKYDATLDYQEKL